MSDAPLQPETGVESFPAFELSPPGHLPGHCAAVSHRRGGVSPDPYRSLNAGRSVADDLERVRENERRIRRALGLSARVARLRLEHGARLLCVTEPGAYGPADALLTDRDDLVLWFTVADCFPLTASAGAWRGHAHCGWRGAAAGLPGILARALAERSGVPAEEMSAWIGPGIGPCCYPVGEEVAARFPDSARRPPDVRGKPRLDLKREIALQLRRAGMREAAVASSPLCTACHPERFFSHRRDGAPSGRMAALSWSCAPGATPPRSSR
jgi:YfiH family protein